MLVKGRGNYLSLRRLRVAQQRATFAARRHARRSTNSCRSAAGRGRRPTAAAATCEFPAAAGRLGPGRERQRQLPRPQVPRLPATASTSRPAGRCTAPNLLVVNHALFFSDLALRRAGREPPARLPGRHLRRGPHARRRGRRPPRHSGHAGGGRVPAEQAVSSAAAAQGAARVYAATTRRVAAVSRRRGRPPSGSSPIWPPGGSGKLAAPAASASRTSSPNPLSEELTKLAADLTRHRRDDSRPTRRRSS